MRRRVRTSRTKDWIPCSTATARSRCPKPASRATRYWAARFHPAMRMRSGWASSSTATRTSSARRCRRRRAEGPRGIIAAATGLALSGRRATAFLSGPDLAAAQDLLISAAGKHAPLVLHLGTRAAAGHGAALGSGHDTVHLGADSGFFMLFAMNVQEAVDFTYIARRVAEEALVPGMVIMDGEQTALAAQDVRLLSPAQIDAIPRPGATTNRVADGGAKSSFRRNPSPRTRVARPG